MWVSRETTIYIWTCLWILYNIQLLKILREVAEKFFRYKMPKTLSGDVAVRTATLLWSSVNSVGSFLTSQMGTFVFIWWVKRICSQSKNLAESQHKTEIGNNIHWKWILLWIFKYFYWLSDLKSYLSLFVACQIHFCLGKVPTHRLEGLRNFHWVWPCMLRASCIHMQNQGFEKYEFPIHKTLIVNYSCLVKNICYRI